MVSGMRMWHFGLPWRMDLRLCDFAWEPHHKWFRPWGSKQNWSIQTWRMWEAGGGWYGKNNLTRWTRKWRYSALCRWEEITRWTLQPRPSTDVETTKQTEVSDSFCQLNNTSMKVNATTFQKRSCWMIYVFFFFDCQLGKNEECPNVTAKMVFGQKCSILVGVNPGTLLFTPKLGIVDAHPLTYNVGRYWLHIPLLISSYILSIFKGFDMYPSQWENHRDPMWFPAGVCWSHGELAVEERGPRWAKIRVSAFGGTILWKKLKQGWLVFEFFF